MDNLALRQRTASEIADGAINLVRANAKLLFTIGGALYLPIVIANVLFMPPTTRFTDADTRMRLILGLVGVLWGAVIEGALTWAASERYLGRDVSAGSAIATAFNRSVSLVFGMLGRYLVISFGTLLLVVPGIFAFLLSFAMPATIVIEGIGPNAAWTRSKLLASGMKKHVAGTLFIAYLVFFVIFITIGLMAGPLIFSTNERALQVLNGALLVIVWPFVVCAQTLLYYDLRIRKEGFDIEHMAGSMEPAAAAVR